MKRRLKREVRDSKTDLKQWRRQVDERKFESLNQRVRKSKGLERDEKESWREKI